MSDQPGDGRPELEDDVDRMQVTSVPISVRAPLEAP
jgi:hypothetical protein